MTALHVYDHASAPGTKPMRVERATDAPVVTLTLWADGERRALSLSAARELAAALTELAGAVPEPAPSLTYNRESAAQRPQGPPRPLRNPPPATPAMRAADTGAGSYMDALALEQLAMELHETDTVHLAGALGWEQLPQAARDRYRAAARSAAR